MNSAPDRPVYHATQGDRLLAALIIAMAIGMLLAKAHRAPDTAIAALIHIGNEPQQPLALTHNQIITVQNAGHPIQLEVDQGRIRVRESACPHKLCQHKGWISQPGEIIACLPNSILIEIIGKTEQAHYDAVSH